jgi:hypothetical protein
MNSKNENFINIFSVIVHVPPLLFETYTGISERTITAAIMKRMHEMQHIAKIGPPPRNRDFLKKRIEVNKITSNVHRQSIQLDLH